LKYSVIRIKLDQILVIWVNQNVCSWIPWLQ